MLLLFSSKVRHGTPPKWITLLFWPIILSRFIVFAPSLYYKVYATNHHNVIKDHAQLYNGTYGTAVVTGERLADTWGSALFLYNIAAWMPTVLFIPPLHLPFTIAETVLTVFVSLATHHQTGYAPHNKKDCHNPMIFGMQPPPGANESFFAAAARLNATVSTPVQMCESFVKEWQFGMTVCSLYALMSLLGIIVFFGAMIDAKKHGTSGWDMLKELGEDLWTCLTYVPKTLLIIIVTVSYFVPFAFFRCLPLSVKTPVRSARRYTIKTGLGAEQNTQIFLTELKSGFRKSRKTTARYQGGEGSHTQLAQFLGVYDILVMVAKDLHYIDVMNLARVSKSVRESVLPSNDLARRISIFKLYTCDADDKRSCWICTNQICVECYQVPAIPQETAIYHMENCIPYCKSCYHVHVLDRPHGQKQRFRKKYCYCGPRRAPPKNALLRFLLNTSYLTKKPRYLESIRRSVCRNCDRQITEELLSLKEKATKSMLKEGIRSDGERWTNCAGPACNKRLGSGPRFWVCIKLNCRKECTSTLHQAWGRKGDVASAGDATV